MSIKSKHQRLVLIAIALVALIGAGLLAAWALRNQASYFYVPSEIVAKPPEAGRAVRLGGMVERGSIKTAPDGVTLNFFVINALVTMELFLITKSFWVVLVALALHGLGTIACLSEPRIFDLWLLRARRATHLRSYRTWRCNSYAP